MAGGLLSTIVVLQFAHVIPWAGDEATYIGGRWTGVVLYLFTAGFFYEHVVFARAFAARKRRVGFFQKLID